MSMSSFENNMMLVMMGSTWGVMGLAFVVPPPYNLPVFLSIYPINFFTMMLHPKFARWIANLRKQKWLMIDNDRDLWTWANSMIQLWFEQDPSQLSEPIFDAFGHFVEWQTFMVLKASDPLRHPYY